MKIIFTFLCLLGLCFSASAYSGRGTPLRCEDAHTGTFEVHAQQMKILVKRDKDFQYEYINGGSIKYKLKWITECTYSLEMVSTDIPQMKAFIGQHYTTTINEIDNNNAFHFTCIYEQDNKSVDGYMIKTTN